jgi:hypothetical protein
MSWILSETRNNLRSHHYPFLITTLATSNLKCVTLLVREPTDMIETSLRSITNSAIVDIYIGSRIFNEDHYQLNHDVKDLINPILHSLCLAIFFLP